MAPLENNALYTWEEQRLLDLMKAMAIHEHQGSERVFKFRIKALLEILQCNAMDRRRIIAVLMYKHAHLTPSNHLQKDS
jgi:hypothetical protein